MSSHSRTVFHPIGLDLELLVLMHRLEEPVVGFTSVVDAIGRLEAEGYLVGWRV